MITVLLIGSACYVVLMGMLITKFFPKRHRHTPSRRCSHQVRLPLQYQSQPLGSDFYNRSRCAGCGSLLTWEPNA